MQNNNNPFVEWKTKNPNGNLNEYYKHAQKNNIQLESYTELHQSSRNELEVKNNNSNSLIIAGLISIVGLIGYFSPWFTIPIFNISVSGHDMRQLSMLISKFTKVKEGALIIKYSWFLPCGYILFFFGNIIKSFLISILSGFIILGMTLSIVLSIHTKAPELIKYINYGCFLNIASSLLLIYHLIKTKF